MDQQGKHLQSTGICHRLFCFFIKSLAAQAAKPVTLGSSLINNQQTRGRYDEPEPELCRVRVDSAERLVSIEIEDETRALLLDDKGPGGQGCCVDERKLKTARKMVSIKEEPEIINQPNKKRRKSERGNNEDVRPLRSILKVGSKLRETTTSVQIISPKHTRNSTIY